MADWDDVEIGTWEEREPSCEVVFKDPALAAHAGRRWFRDAVREALGADPWAADGRQAGTASVPMDADRPHSFLCGGAGMGKTVLSLMLLKAQLERGCSVIALEPKWQTVEKLIGLAEEEGLAPEEVLLLRPSDPDGVPGWNPLARGVPIAQAAAGFADSLAAVYPGTLSDLQQNMLRQSLKVLAANGMGLGQIRRLLRDGDFRQEVLARSPALARGDRTAYDAALDYFRYDLDAKDRSGSAASLMYKLSPILESDFFLALLCAERNFLDLGSLWRRRQFVIVHLDEYALHEDGTKLLGFLLAKAVLDASLSARGPVPVVLSLDEIGSMERFLGPTLTRIITFSREANLRLLMACQSFSQLSPVLKEALTGSSMALKAFFKLGRSDAAEVASWAGGRGPAFSRVELSSAGSRDAAYFAQNVAAVLPPRPPAFDRAAWERKMKQAKEEYSAERKAAFERAKREGAFPKPPVLYESAEWIFLYLANGWDPEHISDFQRDRACNRPRTRGEKKYDAEVEEAEKRLRAKEAPLCNQSARDIQAVKDWDKALQDAAPRLTVREGPGYPLVPAAAFFEEARWLRAAVDAAGHVTVTGSLPVPRVDRSSRSSQSDRTQEWTDTLRELPRRQAALVVGGTLAGVAEIGYFDTPEPSRRFARSVGRPRVRNAPPQARAPAQAAPEKGRDSLEAKKAAMPVINDDGSIS